MKWFAYWWGIQISAETSEEKDLLESLVELLPRKAAVCHESGHIDAHTEQVQDYGPTDADFTIIFHR